jgi:hypothetical protein
MNRRRADRKLHLELLRARAAADRIQLALAMHEISDRLDPLRRAADSIGSVVGALGGARSLKWIAAAGTALARTRWARRAVGGVTAGLRAGAFPAVRALAVGALVAGAVALLIRRTRRSESESGDSKETV